MELDKIHNRMLKHLNLQNREIVLSVLNLMFKFGYVPESWKFAIVSPILKPNKPPGEAVSYRPVSITSCLCKTKERMINSRLEWFFDKNYILPKVQTGFRRGCSTTDNLIRLESAIKSGFNNS